MVVIGLAIALAPVGNTSAADRNGAAAIAVGDYAKAERTLAAERRIFPRRPESMLNLAAVYRQTGRPAKARVLYPDLLAREDVAVDMLNQRTMSAHAVAEASLARLTQVAAR